MMATKSQLVATTLDLDEEGFLRNPDIWNENVARLLARDEVPEELNEEHWRLIGYLRRYFLEFDTVPPVKMIRRYTGLNLQHICKLFPSGLTRGACRIAGIPRIAIRPNFLYP
jgi:tRNA 2-thiouridine synthesizing protein E